METFIKLVNDLERESGTVSKAQRLNSVTDPAPRQEKFVEWIAEAYRMVQTARQDWPWMRLEFEAPLTIGRARYSASDLAIADFGRWIEVPSRNEMPFSVYDPDPTRRREFEQFIRNLPYGQWRAMYDYGTHDANQPIHYAFDPQQRLRLGSTPDKPYIVRGEYYRRPHELVADGDVTIIPPGHEKIVLWRAMMLLGDHDESPTAVSTGQAKYSAGMRNLLNASTQQVTL